jgi:hypothetical protein
LTEEKLQRVVADLIVWDYRILKFHMENPEWKPTKLEEPEEVVLHSRSS